jgi:hypothetical protein
MPAHNADGEGLHKHLSSLSKTRGRSLCRIMTHAGPRAYARLWQA